MADGELSEFSFLDQWQARAAAEMEHLREIWKSDRFCNWERVGSPHVLASFDFEIGLELKYAAMHDDLACGFLQRALAMVQRARREGKLELDSPSEAFPLYRAECLTIAFHAGALLGELLDFESLRQAARDFLDWIYAKPPHAWHEQDQAFCLASIRSMLIVGDVPQAAELVRSTAGVRWVHEEWQWLGMLCELAGSTWRADELRSPLWRYFHRIRKPGYRSEYFARETFRRWEWGVLMWKYLVAQPAADIDWAEAVRLTVR